MSFLLLDRITAYEIGKWAKGLKVVPYADSRSVIALSGRRAFPRTLALEGIVQLASRIIAASYHFSVVPVLGRIDKVMFLGDALPGDVIELEVQIVGLKEDGALVDGSASVNGQCIVELRGLLCPFIGTAQLVDVDRARRVFEELST